MVHDNLRGSSRVWEDPQWSERIQNNLGRSIIVWGFRMAWDGTRLFGKSGRVTEDRGEYITLFPNYPFGKGFLFLKSPGRVSMF